MRLLPLLALSILRAGARITGFSLDIEPPPGSASVDFVNEMAAWRSRLDGTGLRLSADAGTAWSGANYATTVNGSTKLLSEWLVDLCDEAILMDYDRNASNLLVRAEPYLAYADGRPGKAVTVGVAIAPPGTPAAWWQTANVSELEALIASVDAPLRRHRSFTEKYAVFFAETLFNATKAAESLEAASTGEMKSLWYVADEWIYDGAAQSAFFDFARAQRVVELYDAPHAGDRPHIGANATDEALSAEFYRLCDARGISVQFMSGLNTLEEDLRFIQHCFPPSSDSPQSH